VKRRSNDGNEQEVILRNKPMRVLVSLFFVFVLIGCKTEMLPGNFVNLTHGKAFSIHVYDSNVCESSWAYDAPRVNLCFNTIVLTKRTKELKVKGLIRESSDSVPMSDINIVLGEEKGGNIYPKQVIGRTDVNGGFQIVVTADTNSFLYFFLLSLSY
jgi:hypothetical protein